MKRKILLWFGLWLCLFCINAFSAASHDDELDNFLDEQVNVLNAILGGGNSLEFAGDHKKGEGDDKYQLHKPKASKTSKHDKTQQQSVKPNSKANQNSVINKTNDGKSPVDTKKGNELISAYEMQKSAVDLENSRDNLKPFGLNQSTKHSQNSTDQQYKESFVGKSKKPVFFDQGFSKDLNIFTEYNETENLTFSENPFQVGSRPGNFKLAYNEGIITNSNQLKLLAHNLFGEETLEDLLLAKHEIKSFINQADSWIKEVIFDDSHWRLEDAIYGSTAFMFIYDSSVMRFLRKLDGGPESLEQIKDKFNIENGTTDASEKLYAEDSLLASGYYSILEFWKKHARTIIYLLLSFIIIKELIALVSKAVNSRNKAKSRRKRSSKYKKGLQTQASVQTSAVPAYASVTADANVDPDNTREKRQKHSSRRRYSSRRRRPKRSFVRKMLDNIFANSTHNK